MAGLHDDLVSRSNSNNLENLDSRFRSSDLGPRFRS